MSGGVPRGDARDRPPGLGARLWWWLRGRPMLACSFCGLPRIQVGHLVAGDRVNICSACVTRCVDVLPSLVDLDDRPPRCQLCGCARPEVPHLVGHPGRYLCGACVEACAVQIAALEAQAATPVEQLALPGLDPPEPDR